MSSNESKLVRTHADSGDAQKVCSQLVMHASKSTMASVHGICVVGTHHDNQTWFRNHLARFCAFIHATLARCPLTSPLSSTANLSSSSLRSLSASDFLGVKIRQSSKQITRTREHKLSRSIVTLRKNTVVPVLFARLSKITQDINV